MVGNLRGFCNLDCTIILVQPASRRLWVSTETLIWSQDQWYTLRKRTWGETNCPLAEHDKICPSELGPKLTKKGVSQGNVHITADLYHSGLCGSCMETVEPIVLLWCLLGKNTKFLKVINYQPKSYRHLIDLPKMNSTSKITHYIRNHLSYEWDSADIRVGLEL
jgi:hypothetical protein